MKNKIILIVIIALLIVGIGISIIVSFEKFSTFNPISALSGIIKVTTTEAKYVVIQKKPWQVIIAKPTYDDKSAQELLDEYMAERGYYSEDEKRMGALITYSNGTDSQRVFFIVNGYYSVWEWT